MLKPYMGYSREGGSIEGAVLIFANNIKEAKRIGSGTILGLFTDEYIDVAVTLIKEKIDYLSEKNNRKWSIEKLKANIPHVLNDPVCCKHCERWGNDLNGDGICEDCAEQIEFDKQFQKV